MFKNGVYYSLPGDARNQFICLQAPDHQSVQPAEVNTMSKSRDAKKDSKKKPRKSVKEKRQAKRAKKERKYSTGIS